MNRCPSVVEATPAPLPHRPYIAANTRIPEMTLRAVLVGSVLGVIFGASSLYLVLKPPPPAVQDSINGALARRRETWDSILRSLKWGDSTPR